MDASLPPLPPPVKDMSTWLKVFGVLTTLLGLLLGFLALLLAGFALWGRSEMAKGGGSAVQMVPGVVMYGAMAILCVWLGIGSMMARRWARALLLVGAWLGLILGIVIVVTMLVILPPILKSALSQQGSGSPGGAELAFMAIPFLFVFVFTVVIPAVWAFFYSRKSVKATCEARNPAPSWTDACPLPVLAVSLVAIVGAPSLLVAPLVTPSVLPFFGLLLSGPIAAVGTVLLGFLFLWLAWGFYKLQPAAWWTYIAVIVLAMLSNVITYSLHDMDEVYRLMNYSGEQMKYIENSPFIKGRLMVWLSIASLLPLLGYLFYIRSSFPV